MVGSLHLVIWARRSVGLLCTGPAMLLAPGCIERILQPHCNSPFLRSLSHQASLKLTAHHLGCLRFCICFLLPLLNFPLAFMSLTTTGP